MNYLEGEHLKIDTPTLRKNKGKKVKYLVKGWGEARYGTIEDVIKKQVDLGNMDYIPFDRIVEIVLI